ncbi:MAG: hypothetical protein GTO12_05025 [Proteobacteria bacterium]|nr:hypothetical protein [Pseudomonadota bacterium]
MFSIFILRDSLFIQVFSLRNENVFQLMVFIVSRKVKSFVKRSRPVQIHVKLKIAIILGAISGITLFHYLTGINPLNHQIYGKLYYAPVVLAALWFGVTGGLSASITVALVLAAHSLADWGNNITGVWGVLLEVPILNLAGLLIGYLADRERKRKAHWNEVSQLASIGKTYTYLAHEIKNIAISIHGFAKLTTRRTNLSDDVMRFLGIIEKESERMERLARDALFSPDDSTVKKERHNFNQFLQEIISISREMAKLKGINYYSEVKEDLPSICLDSDRMKEVLLNLTQNAIHATPPGGSIVLRAFGNNGRVKVQIADTGKGVSPGSLDKIFLPFFTTKSEGMGMGLAISKKIVEAHGATIEVESEERKGTRFTISFPVHP